MTNIKGMTFRSKCDKYLNRVHKVKMKLKQTYSNYYGQTNEEKKGSLTKVPESEKAHQEKDVLTLQKLLKNINFNYRRSKEPTKTMWQAGKDFINSYHPIRSVGQNPKKKI